MEDNASPVRSDIILDEGVSTGGDSGAGLDSTSTSIFCSGSVTMSESVFGFGFGLLSVSPSSWSSFKYSAVMGQGYYILVKGGSNTGINRGPFLFLEVSGFLPR